MPSAPFHRALRAVAATAAVALLAAACSGGGSSPASSAPVAGPARQAATTGLTISVLSSPPTMVTGGDAIVAVDPPDGSNEKPLVAALNARNVSELFELGDGRYVAHLDGLVQGDNVLTVALGDETAEITLVNHESTGPVFSGPQAPLPVCTTELLGLGRPIDEKCSAPSRTTWSYRSTNGSFKPLDDPDARPDDLATTFVDGREVNFILREEKGTINRAVYWIRALDPEPGDEWDPRGWNGRLVYRFGGGCGASYSQGVLLAGSDDPELYARGYAVATSTFNTFQTACNDVLSAETALMVKEHFTESYGIPKFTIGEGGSGGAIQQLLIAQNYPGILDALAISLPFPDAVTTAAGVADCGLLVRFFDGPEGEGWSEHQRTAVQGHLTEETCRMWSSTFLPAGIATVGCDPAIPEEMVYDPEENPSGLRCTIWDTNENVWGMDESGYAKRPLDNEGVQYGLTALNEGIITVDQFLGLNEMIGGFDADGLPQPERMVADPETLERAYASGRVLTGESAVTSIPIIAINVYTDPLGDIHDRQRVFAIRERLRDPQEGDSPNYVIWTRPAPESSSALERLAGTAAGASDAIFVLDLWLTALEADDSKTDPAVRLEETRPPEAVDTCLTPAGDVISGVGIYAAGSPCQDIYPSASDPRRVAGAPLANDVLKCQLRSVAEAIDAGVYAVEFSATQRLRLESIFATGVCDWSARGVGQVPLDGTWLSYGR